MSRRQKAVPRETPPDAKYGSQEVTRFVNVLMLDGKKSTAEGIFYDAMRKIEEKTGQPGLNVFRQALANAKPVLEVRSRRVGGAIAGRIGPDRSLTSAPVSRSVATTTSGFWISTTGMQPRPGA